MKKIILSVLLVSFTFYSFAQSEYEPSKEHPFGKLNPNAPEQTGDYKDLIGISNCTSQRRNPDRTWGDPVKMTWRWKYIMNGMGVQDETIKDDNSNSGSIRQYSKDSMRWNVHFYSSLGKPSSVLRAWYGNKEKDGRIVLYRDSPAPNGMEGVSRLTFYDIDKNGFKWIGEWVDKNKTIVFPFWKIECVRKKD